MNASSHSDSLQTPLKGKEHLSSVVVVVVAAAGRYCHCGKSGKIRFRVNSRKG